MAQKKSEDGYKDTLKQIISSTIISQIKDGVKNFGLKVQKAVYNTERRIVESILTSVILLCGLVFIVIALALIISDYFKIGNQWGFFIMGIILVVIALIFRERTKKIKIL